MYYKTFAFGRVGNRSACAFATGKYQALERCRQSVKPANGWCEVYAASPIDGGKVTLAEVKNYLDDRMTRRARRLWGRHQNAHMRGDGATVLAAGVASGE